MKPKISILVAVYNVGEFLPHCVETLLVQTYQNLEIILIDDGSTDNSAEICDKYAELDERVRVIHQKNQGLSAVRNVGIKKATGEWVCLVDGDDFVKRDYVEELYRTAVEGDAEVAVCGFVTTPDGAKERLQTRVLSGEEAVRELLVEQENYQIVSWNKLYKKKLFDGIKFPVGEKHEDSFTTYKILRAATRVAIADEALYFYRQREGSIMNEEELEERLQTKLRVAEAAKKDLRGDEKLYQAAEITELLAYLAFIDNIIAGKVKLDANKYYAWVRKNKEKLLKNPQISVKLKSYIYMITLGGGVAYKIFRKLKH